MAGITNSNSSSNSISTLFGSFSASGMSSMIADYNSIKNGSYGKLLKSYYKQSGVSGTSSSSSSRSSDVLSKILEEKKNPTVSKEVTEANSSLSKGVSDVKSSISTLQTDSLYETPEDGTSAKDKVASGVKSFISDYNSMISSAKKSTNSGMTSNVADMMKATSANKEELASIGITVNKDGSLSLNESKLKAADLSDVKAVFSAEDRNSYGAKISGKATTASYYGTDSSISVSSETAEKIEKASSDASDLKTDAQSLASGDLFAKLKDDEGNETDEYDISSITSKVKSYIKNYNDMLKSAANLTNSGVAANLGNILNKTKASADALGQFGITVDKSGNLSLNEETFKKSDMSEVKSFFKDYGSSVASFASLIDYYSSTQANATNSYQANGTYSTSALSSYTDSI